MSAKALTVMPVSPAAAQSAQNELAAKIGQATLADYYGATAGVEYGDNEVGMLTVAMKLVSADGSLITTPVHLVIDSDHNGAARQLYAIDRKAGKVPDVDPSAQDLEFYARRVIIQALGGLLKDDASLASVLTPFTEMADMENSEETPVVQPVLPGIGPVALPSSSAGGYNKSASITSLDNSSLQLLDQACRQIANGSPSCADTNSCPFGWQSQNLQGNFNPPGFAAEMTKRGLPQLPLQPDTSTATPSTPPTDGSQPDGSDGSADGTTLTSADMTPAPAGDVVPDTSAAVSTDGGGAPDDPADAGTTFSGDPDAASGGGDSPDSDSDEPDDSDDDDGDSSASGGLSFAGKSSKPKRAAPLDHATTKATVISAIKSLPPGGKNSSRAQAIKFAKKGQYTKAYGVLAQRHSRSLTRAMKAHGINPKKKIKTAMAKHVAKHGAGANKAPKAKTKKSTKHAAGAAQGRAAMTREDLSLLILRGLAYIPPSIGHAIRALQQRGELREAYRQLEHLYPSALARASQELGISVAGTATGFDFGALLNAALPVVALTLPPGQTPPGQMPPATAGSNIDIPAEYSGRQANVIKAAYALIADTDTTMARSLVDYVERGELDNAIDILSAHYPNELRAAQSQVDSMAGWNSAGLSIAGSIDVGDSNWLTWAVTAPDAAAGDLYTALCAFFNGKAINTMNTLKVMNTPAATQIYTAVSKMYTEKTGKSVPTS